jgi:hypothetical protein
MLLLFRYARRDYLNTRSKKDGITVVGDIAKLCAFRALLARLCDHTADFTSRDTSRDEKRARPNFALFSGQSF